MKKIIAVFLCIVSFAFAEYQAFNFTMSIKRAEPVFKTDGTKTATVTLKGILVTVCCYPCGASFGKAYPSWLYVIRSNDKEKILWKVPVWVNGGIFGQNISAEYMEEKLQPYRFTERAKPVVKKANRSWVYMSFKTYKAEEILYKEKKFSEMTTHGMLGYTLNNAELTLSGYGTAAVKTNKKIDEWLNPYISYATGTVTGLTDTVLFSFDPSNYLTYNQEPLTGTFSIRFNNSLTEALRGTADWKILDRRVYQKLKYKSIVEEEPNEALMW